MWKAAVTSWTGSSARLMRTVSPMPSLSRTDMAEMEMAVPASKRARFGHAQVLGHVADLGETAGRPR